MMYCMLCERLDLVQVVLTKKTSRWQKWFFSSGPAIYARCEVPHLGLMFDSQRPVKTVTLHSPHSLSKKTATTYTYRPTGRN